MADSGGVVVVLVADSAAEAPAVEEREAAGNANCSFACSATGELAVGYLLSLTNSASIRSNNKNVEKIVQEALHGLIEDCVRRTATIGVGGVVWIGGCGDQIELRSDYNLLISLHRITPADLRQAQAPMREWQRLGHPLPVYFTVEELSDAADVFPIEFHQMSQARILL